MTRMRIAGTALIVVLAGSVGAPARAASDLPAPYLRGFSFVSNMAWAPDGRLFILEKDAGNVLIAKDGRVLPQPFVHLDVEAGGETGLLGIALHPDFESDPWVYLYESDRATGRNRIVRMRAHGDAGGSIQPVFDAIEWSRGIHNGGDLAFGLDGKLYAVLGETAEPERAQDPADPGGKVLRLNDDGSVPPDNPFGPTDPAYSMGHRNSFGLCVDPSTGNLWETENGTFEEDEVNLIRAGGNYGWPVQLGPGGEAKGFIDPVVDFPQEIVPTGCAVWDGNLYIGAFGDRTIRRISLPLDANPEAVPVAQLPEGVTDLEVGPDGALYISTPSTIWRLAAPPAGAIAPAAVPHVPIPNRGRWVAILVGALIGLGALALRAARRRATASGA